MTDKALRDAERRERQTDSPADLAKLDVERLRVGDIQGMSRDGVLAALLQNAPPDLLEGFEEQWNDHSLPYTECKKKYGQNTELFRLLLAQERRTIGFKSKRELESVPRNERELIRSAQVTSRSRDLKALREFARLRHLKLRSTGGITTILNPIPIGTILTDLVGYLNELRSLDISHRPVSEAGFEGIAKFPSLQILEADGAYGLRDEHLVHIAKIKGLLDLDLNRTGISDGGVGPLSTLQDLEFLNVSNTGISATGISELAMELRSLRHLLADNIEISESELRLLKVLRPNLEIHNFHDDEYAEQILP